MSKVRTINFWSQEARWHVPSLFFSCVVLFLLRKPLYILTQPGRVEDVDVLLSQALQYGWQSVFVLYNYYFHLVPRLVTLFSLSLLGIANVNLGMNLGAIIIASLCASFFAKKQFRFLIKSDLLRAICSLFIVLVPGVDEIYSNISSIQWFLNIFIMLFVTLLLFKYEEFEKKSKKTKYLYSFLLSFSILSSAFSLVFLVPLAYVIVRELRRKGNLVTIASHAIPTFFLVFEAVTLYITYTQQFRSSSLGLSGDVILPAANAFAISVSKIFYHDTPGLFGHIGSLMYAIPLGVVAFAIACSVKERSRFEIFAILCMVTTLFWSAAVRGNMLDWNCLCGQAEGRYFFFTVVFAFVLLVKQFDKAKTIPHRSVFLAFLALVILNISSGFFIESFADQNWKHVTSLYDASGIYHCYVGEVPHGWAISVPCLSAGSNSSAGISSEFGPSVTFTPPIVATKTTVSNIIPTGISGIPLPFTATIYPTPDSGTVQFQIDGRDEGYPITVIGGKATLGIPALQAGRHQVSALYSGAPNFFPSASSPFTITVLSKSGLKDANLTGVDLSGIDLSDSYMEGAHLSGSNMQQANLSGANLQDANLQSANLQNANLTQANLEGANLRGTILSYANLTNANLDRADITGANFAGSIVKGCHGCPPKSQ